MPAIGTPCGSTSNRPSQLLQSTSNSFWLWEYSILKVSISLTTSWEVTKSLISCFPLASFDSSFSGWVWFSAVVGSFSGSVVGFSSVSLLPHPLNVSAEAKASANHFDHFFIRYSSLNLKIGFWTVPFGALFWKQIIFRDKRINCIIAIIYINFNNIKLFLYILLDFPLVFWILIS